MNRASIIARTVKGGELPSKPLLAFLAVSALGCGVLAAGSAAAALIFPVCLLLLLIAASSPELPLLVWVLASPFAAAYLRYPYEQSVITFDRLAVPALFLLAVYSVVKNGRSLRLGLVELFWGLFALWAVVDVLWRGSSAQALKLAVDAFALPWLLLIAARGLDFERGAVLKALIFLSVSTLLPGLLELTGVDLWPFPGADLTRDGVIRPNSVYVSDNSYALISLLLALALIFWPKEVEARLRLARKIAVVAALTGAMLPQFRAVALAAVVCITLGYVVWRGWREVLAVSLLVGALVSGLLLIGGGSRLTDPTNMFNRLATYKVALTVIRDHSLSGVGLGMYEDYFRARHTTPANRLPYTQEQLARVPQSTPHNNLLSVAAETGLAGLLLYALAMIAPFLQGYWLWKANKRDLAAGVWSIWLGYQIVGMTLTSGYYSDANLFLLFLHGVFVRLADD